MQINFTCRLCDADLSVEVVVTSPAVEGRYTGPWEDCYPSEAAEWHSIPDVVVCPECQATHDIANDHEEMVLEALNDYDDGCYDEEPPERDWD